MPSDDPRLQLAREALAVPFAEFHAALAGALVQAEAVLAEAVAGPEVRAARAAAELGKFAEGSIDSHAFAASFGRGPADSAGQTALQRAVVELRAVVAQGVEPFVIQLAPGADLLAALNAALERVGRCFGAVILAERVRSGRYLAQAPDPMLHAVAFAEWTRGQRRLAPPLIVSLEGRDLDSAALSRFCDGRAKLLLLLNGECAPAPLVRLITPGTLVLQTTDGTGLERFAAYDGPAVAAFVPAGAARFLHDPAGGREPWQRFSMLELPKPPRRGLAGISAWQLGEDLEQLAALARTPFKLPSPKAAPVAALGEPDAVERLASWLLAEHNPEPS